MIPTLLQTITATDTDSDISFTSNINSTYDEYWFVMNNISPNTDDSGNYFGFQGNASSQSGYNEVMTSAMFKSGRGESSGTEFAAAEDQNQATGLRYLFQGIGGGADESGAGILRLYSPSNTSYVKCFSAAFSGHYLGIHSYTHYTAGYFNVTAAITDIQFKFSSGTIDSGIIDLYGIA